MKNYVYNFNSKLIEKIKNPKNILGGKGANLAEMGRLISSTSGFIISTEACQFF